MKDDVFNINHLKAYIKNLQNERFCGKIEVEVKMYQGGISSVQLRESRSYKKMSLSKE